VIDTEGQVPEFLGLDDLFFHPTESSSERIITLFHRIKNIELKEIVATFAE